MTSRISFLHDHNVFHKLAALSVEAPVMLEALQQIVLNASALIEAPRCSLALLDGTGTALVTRAAIPVEGERLRHTPFLLNEGIAGWVAQQRESVLLNQVVLDERFKWLGNIPVGSMLCVPLVHQGGLLGTLTVSDPQTEAFDSSKTRLLEIFGKQAVLTLMQVQQTMVVQEQGKRMEHLMQIARRMLLQLEPATLQHTLLNDIQRLIPCTRAVLYGYEVKSQQFQVVAEWPALLVAAENEQVGGATGGANSDLAERRPPDLQESIKLASREEPGWAAQHCQPLWEGSGGKDEEQLGELCVPLQTKDVLYGVLRLSRLKPFSREERRDVHNLAIIAAAALEKIELFQRIHANQADWQEAARIKSNFLSMITHELRSPINSINGYLDLVLDGVAGELNKQQHNFLQRSRASSENLYALLEDLFLISRADAGQLRLNRDVVYLPEIVTHAIEELELMAADHGISIQVDVPAHLPQLYADSMRLQQVLRNLISNAVRFTGDGGQVVISARVEQAATALFSGDLSGDLSSEVTHVLKLRVSDTGVGIATEFQQRIFERFFQVPDAGSGRTSGQGLGLAIVKMIVELHGGIVQVESLPERGSTFSCLLPCLSG